jgi:hypothetical protein
LAIIILIGGILGNVLRFSEKISKKEIDFDVILFSYNGYSGSERPPANFTRAILQADTRNIDKFTVGGVNFLQSFYPSIKNSLPF